MRVNIRRSEPRSNLGSITNFAGVIENFNMNTETNYNYVKLLV